MNKTVPLKYNHLTHFLFAVIIVANSLTWILGINYSLIIITVPSFLFIVVLNAKSIKRIGKNKHYFFILFMYIFFLFSFLKKEISDTTMYYFLQFTILGVLPLFITKIKINIRTLLIFIVLIGIIFIPYVLLFDFDEIASSTQESIYGMIMGRSYGLIPYAIASIILLFMTPKNKFLKLIIWANLASVSYFLFMWGNRGAVLAIVIAPLFYYFIWIKDKKGTIGKLAVISIIVIILLLFLVYFFENTLYPILNDYGFTLRFYDKTIRLIEIGNLTNGRNDILEVALLSFLEKPFFGYGIGSFELHTGINYPHNLIVQFLYEGGFLLAIPMLYLIIKAVLLMFSNYVIFNDKILLMFLFLSSVIQLMFSTYPWQSQVFWLLIGFVLNIDNNNNKYENSLHP